jgi:predicted PurR-regulated permease PerM
MINFFKNNNNTQISLAYLSVILVLFIILQFHVTPAVLAGFLAYVLTKDSIKKVQEKFPNIKIKEQIVGAVIGIISLVILGVFISSIINALNGDKISQLIGTLIDTLNKAKSFLPDALDAYIPDSTTEAKETLVNAFKSNINSFASFGQNALHVLLLIIIGWLIGILIACKNKKEDSSLFSRTWLNLWLKLSESFRFVVFAQVKVALFNSSIITIFLFIVCPLVSWHLPYSKTLVILTFICGLLPIIGNLIANTITFTIALTVSLPAALAALVVLILIHKLEYLIISKSLGTEIGSDVWELLIVLFAGEMLFGTSGLVFAPILYTFFKKEMTIGYLGGFFKDKESN